MRQVLLYADAEDEGWIAEVPSLPDCITQGETKEEAIIHVRDAIVTWIDGIPTDSWDVQVCFVF
ncbi:type II toxin-antitoxin system HicB family antitoxin [Blastopirellula sp. J2-11]|uniref:type II toxin-antitoxin system HicB family antitoxin n=1 Tax=Blastopirellula sp. J2-11 TaxID=2943192 RepID=UPI0021C92203|nr:type II toxin-antitoxin system HicB family antitoxin [Blastopirellula sp. J2-11]UUO07608.1 type II toxin-antitoxin system HicB family antitoxin [Blastopirellula sp. J2-11]